MRCTCPSGRPVADAGCPLHGERRDETITVECEYGVGVGTPDLKLRVNLSPDRPLGAEAYPQAAGCVTGEAGRVEAALEEALRRVREARRRYRWEGEGG